MVTPTHLKKQKEVKVYLVLGVLMVNVWVMIMNTLQLQGKNINTNFKRKNIFTILYIVLLV